MIQTAGELREFVTQGVFTTDADLNILSWNYWLEIHTGYSSSQVLGRNLLALYPDLVEREYDEAYRRALAGEFIMLAHRLHGYLLSIPLRGHLAGAYPYMQQTARIAPLKRAGQISGTMTLIEDVTDRVAQEDDLNRQITALRTLQEIERAILTLNVAECLRQIVAGAARLTEAPTVALALCNEDGATISLAAFQGDWPEHDPAHLRQTAVAQVAFSGQPLVLGDREQEPSGLKVLAPESRSLAAVPLIVDEETIGALAVESPRPHAFERHQEYLPTLATQAAIAIRNARQHKQLQQSEARLHLMVERLPAGVLLLDQQQRILLANPAARDYLPLLADAHQPGELINRLAGRAPAALAQETTAGDWLEVMPAGENGPVFQVAGRLLDAESDSRYLFILRDVTHETQLERQLRQQERLAAVGQLAAGIAHDFNNVVASIILYSELMLQDAKLVSPNRERVRTIHQQGEHAARLVHQILDFSRQSILIYQPIDLSHFLLETEALLRRTLPANITLAVEPGAGNYLIKGDLGRLEQALLNLVINAQQAMPDGGSVRLELKSLTLAPDETPPAPEMAPGDWICLVVTDSGPGIPPEVLTRIFEPFFTTKPPAESTGLGLSQVYGIMRQHGGHITVTSRPEEGAQFTLYWPPLPSTGPPDSPVSAPKAKRPASPRPGLLLIEDDPVLHQVLADMFSEEGYRVFVAGNGRDAWRHFEEHESAIGLALIDVALPDMSGLDLYHLLRERAPQLPVILMSGYPITLEAQALLEYGQLDWLQKPFTTDELLRRVEDYYP